MSRNFFAYYDIFKAVELDIEGDDLRVYLVVPEKI